MKKSKDVFSVRAQGDSMYPLLQNGDSIEYRHTPFKSIQLNDIILVYTGDILMTHRVIYKTKGGCITRGDNNNLADTQLQKGQVLAKAIRFKRKNKWHTISEVYLSQSITYLNEIRKLETLLRSNNLKHVFIKGVLVSLKYIGNVPRRIYADCDILIERNDYSKIREIFSKLGYHYSVISHPFVSDKNPEQKPELNFVKRVNGIPVIFDVHLEPVFLMLQLGGMNLLYPRLEELGKYIINRKKTPNIHGFSYSLCSPSDQILYLALHIFHHNYTDIVRYQLLDAVVRKAGNEKVWKDITHTILSFQLDGYLYLVFILLRKYCKTPIPNSFLRMIRPNGFKKIAIDVFESQCNVFGEGSRLKAGIERFVLVFLLSPEPMWRKALLFVYPETLISIIRVIWIKAISQFHKKA